MCAAVSLTALCYQEHLLPPNSKHVTTVKVPEQEYGLVQINCELNIFWFSFIFSPKQHLSTLGYFAPLLWMEHVSVNVYCTALGVCHLNLKGSHQTFQLKFIVVS